ncbi:MAG: glycosyltransferase family 4 protein [Clostridium sp.]|nr:glycosyltransferase family 4 protein [Clostridium sp.]
MYNLASELAKMGHAPIVFCESDHNGKECVNGFKVISLNGPQNNLICKPWIGLKATIYTIRHIKDVDFIHYNAWPPSLWSPLAALFGIRSLMQGHGLEWQRSKYSKPQQTILKLMEWLTAHLNKNLIMCSESQTIYFRDKYKKNAITIPTAISLPSNSDQKTDILDRFSLQPKRYILFMARLVQDKNPDFLIKAFKKTNTDGYRLVIAGNNPTDEKYVKHLHSLADNCSDIVFTDAVLGQDKETLLKNAAAFCLPSTIEGLSISLLEAMSHKIPIIASDIEANREILEADKALWVKAEDEESLAAALEKFTRQKDMMTEEVEYNYKKVVSHYTWPIVAQKYIKHLQTLRK